MHVHNSQLCMLYISAPQTLKYIFPRFSTDSARKFHEFHYSDNRVGLIQGKDHKSPGSTWRMIGRLLQDYGMSNRCLKYSKYIGIS